MGNNYDAMTDDEFDSILTEIVDEGKASQLLQIPGVYEEVREHFNNEVLTRWEERQGAKSENQNQRGE